MTEEQRRVAGLYTEYGPIIYRRCLKLLRDRELARDATQEVFLKLTRDLSRLDERETLLPWIYRTATHHCLNVIRDSHRRERKHENLGGWDMAAVVTQENVTERHLAARVLARFDAQTQAVAIGVLVDGMQHEEVASALGLSRKTVSRKLDRFLTNAKKYIARSST